MIMENLGYLLNFMFGGFKKEVESETLANDRLSLQRAGLLDTMFSWLISRKSDSSVSSLVTRLYSKSRSNFFSK